MGWQMQSAWNAIDELPMATSEVMESHLAAHQYGALVERRLNVVDEQSIYPFSVHLALFTASWKSKQGRVETLLAQDEIERSDVDERFFLYNAHLAVMPDRMWNYIHPPGSLQATWLGKCAGTDGSDNLAIVREGRKLRKADQLTWDAIVAHELAHCSQVMDNVYDEKHLCASAQQVLREAITEMHAINSMAMSGRSQPHLFLRRTLKHRHSYYFEAFYASQVLSKERQGRLIDLLSEKAVSDWSVHDFEKNLGMHPKVWEKLSKQLATWSELDVDDCHPLYSLQAGNISQVKWETNLKKLMVSMQTKLIAEHKAARSQTTLF
jgi:phage tail protein X